jgi:DNA-directed RNA polymerase specialized sigma24 family protein
MQSFPRLRIRDRCVYQENVGDAWVKTRQRDILHVLDREGAKLHRLLYRLTLDAGAAKELLQNLVVEAVVEA